MGAIINNKEIRGNNYLLIQQNNKLYLKIRERLKYSDVNVYYASNIQSALNCVTNKNLQIDITLIDYLLCPSISNPSITNFIRLTPNNSIYISCSVYSQVIEKEFIKKGIIGFIQSPVELEQFLEINNDHFTNDTVAC